MATIRGIIKEVNEEDFYIVVETVRGEEVKVLVDNLNYNEGEAVIIRGFLRDGIINEPRMVIRFPNAEVLELDEKANEKLWNFYEPLVKEYREKNLASIDEALEKLDEDEGGEE